MAVLKAYDALAAEREAAEAEGVFEPTTEQIADLRRYKALSVRKGAIDAEMAAIKKKVVAEMESIGAKALAVNGKKWVNIVSWSTDVPVLDLDRMAQEHPDVVNSYKSLMANYTTTVSKPGGRTDVKPV